MRLALLERLVRIESPSEYPAGVRQVLDVLAEEFERLGAANHLIDDAAVTCLVADIVPPGVADAETVLFVGHADTVWPLGTIKERMPWRLSEEHAHGPGVFDMKSGLVVMIEAIARAQENGLRRAVRVVIVGDEEIGSPEGAAQILAAAEGCHAAIGFESPHPDGALKVGRHGVSRVEIDVTGVAAHIALDPDQAVSAIDELVDQLIRVRQIAETFSTASGTVLHSVGAIRSDGRTNVSAASASATIGFRFPTPDQQERVLDSIRSLTTIRERAGLTIRAHRGRPVWAARPEDLSFARALDPNGPPPRPAAGAADTNALGHLPIPVVDGFGPRGAGAHALHEHICLSDLDDRIELLSRWLCS